MNEEDLRDCFAMFAMVGLLIDGSYTAGMKGVSQGAYEMADVMLEARKKKYWVEEEETAGLPAIKRKARKS